MAKCKMGNCREEAIPGGKRYCPHHMAEYRRKQREYDAIAATLRNCTCCGEKLSKSRHDAGESVCGTCQQRHDALERIDNARNEQIDSLDACDTLDELKNWLKERLIK